jgi:predicted HicB family RNase H-like nuclease
MPRAKKGEAQPKMKAVMFTIDEDFHTKVKVAASAARMTLKEFIIRAMAKAVEEGGEPKKK